MFEPLSFRTFCLSQPHLYTLCLLSCFDIPTALPTTLSYTSESFLPFQGSRGRGNLTLGRCHPDVLRSFPTPPASVGENERRQKRARDCHVPETLLGSKLISVIPTTSLGENPGTTGAGPGTFQATPKKPNLPKRRLADRWFIWMRSEAGLLPGIMISCVPRTPSGNHSWISTVKRWL